MNDDDIGSIPGMLDLLKPVDGLGMNSLEAFEICKEAFRRMEAKKKAEKARRGTGRRAAIAATKAKNA